jgi:pimeloyl-ACP methyl ester carboxylesterase
MKAAPQTRYAKGAGGYNIAYQVAGEGDVDLVFVPGFVSHVELAWEWPPLARFLERLSSFSRLILFDKRGTGLSDRVPASELPTLEERMDDVRAVMDAAGSECAAVFGVSEGGPMSVVFAATYPERVSHLVLYGTQMRFTATEDHDWLPQPKTWRSWPISQSRNGPTARCCTYSLPAWSATRPSSGGGRGHCATRRAPRRRQPSCA